MRLDKVPGKGLPSHIPGNVIDCRDGIHLPYLLWVQSIRQVSVGRSDTSEAENCCKTFTASSRKVPCVGATQFLPAENPDVFAAGQGVSQLFFFGGDGGILVPLPDNIPLLLPRCGDAIAVDCGLQIGMDPGGRRMAHHQLANTHSRHFELVLSVLVGKYPHHIDTAQLLSVCLMYEMSILIMFSNKFLVNAYFIWKMICWFLICYFEHYLDKSPN